MTSRILPGLSLRAFWDLGEAGWKAGMDENIFRLSFLAQSRVFGVVTELPLTPENGDRYILNDTGSAYHNHIAVYDLTLWVYIMPEDRFVVFNTDNDNLMYYHAGDEEWVSLISPEAIKVAYEMNDDTNAFTNEEKAKLADIEDDATGDMSPAEIKAAYEENLNTNAFTDTEKAKLAGLSSSRFLGVYTTLGSLQASHPAPPQGSFGYVDRGADYDIVAYIWDANTVKYVAQASGSPAETPETVKLKYEANDDTNAFTDAEQAKLAALEDGATADLTGAEIKVFYEAEADTNAYTDAEKSKLAGIESGATADQTASEIKIAYESNNNTNAFTDSEQLKLAGIESDATADLTGSEIKALYEAEANTNAYTDAEKTKLAGLEDSLFMGTYTSLVALQTAHPTALPGSYVYVDLGVGQDVSLYIWDNDDADWLASIAGVATETPTSVKSKYESNADTNAYTNIEKSKLAGIENGATADQTASEIKAAYESNADTNAFTNALKTKLDSLILFSGSYEDLTDIPDTIPDADVDGKMYARKNASWVEIVKFYDLNLFIQGKPSAEELLLFYKVITPFKFPTSMPNSSSKSIAASVSNVFFSIRKNNIEVGRVTFNNTDTGVFTLATETTYSLGDILAIIGPEIADVEMSDICINLKGSVI